MKSKKVLILVRDFPPYYPSLGGVIRVIKLGDFLRSEGYRVHVVAAAGEEIGYHGYRNVIDGFDVHYVADPFQRHENRFAKNPPSPPTAARPKKPLKKIVTETISEMSVPDVGVFFARGLYRKALDVVTENEIENVIVSSPPFSTQIAGLMLKRRLDDRINLIVDYRDSWNTISIFAKRWPIARALNRSLERRVLSASDCLLYQSPPVIEKVERMFPGAVRRSQLVMNGYDPAMALPEDLPPPKNPMLTIGHFGAINDGSRSFRDPSALLSAVAKLDLPVRFNFYGAARFNARWEDILGDRFVIKGNLSHTDALLEMARMDALLLIHSDPMGADEVIPAKIFEYMLTGRPIFAAGPANMESAKIVRDHGLGYAADILDRADVGSTLQRILADWRTGRSIQYDRATLVAFSRTSQYTKVLPLLR